MKGTKRILVVDDEEDLRIIIAEHLDFLGFQTVMSENAERGLEELKRGNIDLIVSDVRMPGMGGVAFLEVVRQSGPRPPIILVSGHSDMTRDEAVRRGAVDLLPKPLDFKLLAELVRDSLK